MDDLAEFAVMCRCPSCWCMNPAAPDPDDTRCPECRLGQHWPDDSLDDAGDPTPEAEARYRASVTAAQNAWLAARGRGWHGWRGWRPRGWGRWRR